MDFRDCIFPKLDAGGLRCYRRGQFDRAVFTGKSFLERAKFYGGASFQDAQFGQNVSFLEATFHERWNFKNARFDSGARFEGAEFALTLDLRNAWIGTYAIFDYCTFAGDPPVDLERARGTSSSVWDFRRTWPPGWIACEAEPFDLRGQSIEPFMYLLQPDSS